MRDVNMHRQDLILEMVGRMSGFPSKRKYISENMEKVLYGFQED